jgi:DNA polymerase-3 subunit epsilon
MSKPIVWLDLETTGVSVSTDRIIEICMIKLFPDGKKDRFYSKVEPEGYPISEGALGKHGISNESLLNEPKFVDIAKQVYAFIKDCDLGGYNCIRFDIPLLFEEFIRCGIFLAPKDFNIVDVFAILNKKEPRTLAGVYERFTGKNLEHAHSAEADIEASIEIFDIMKKQWNLPNTAEDIFTNILEGKNMVDFEGKLVKRDNNYFFNFGKYIGKSVTEVWNKDKGYFDWIITKSTSGTHTKTIFKMIKDKFSKNNKG